MLERWCCYNGQLILNESIDDGFPELTKEIWMCRGNIRLAKIEYPPIYNREGIAFPRNLSGDQILASIQKVYYPNKLGWGDITTDVQGSTPDDSTKH